MRGREVPKKENRPVFRDISEGCPNVTTHTETRLPPISPGAVKPSKGSSIVRWLLPLGLIAAAIGGGWWWMHEPKSHAGAAIPDSASGHHGSVAGAPTVTLEVVRPRQGGIVRTSTQPGSVHWFEAAELYAKISGYLKEQSVDIGTKVKQGDLLAVIDNPELIEDAKRAAAAVLQAEAAVAQADARVRTSEADLKTALAMVKKAEAEIGRYASTRRFHEKQLNRYKGLLGQKALPQQMVDEEEDRYESAIAAERSAEAEVFASKAKVTSSEAMVEQAKADLAEAKANVTVARSNLSRANVFVDYTRIVSPYTGVVTFRGFHRGDFIRSAEAGGETPILTVARTDKVRVVTHVPDRVVTFTDVGDKAKLTPDALPGEVFEGTVTRFAQTEDPHSRTMRTEVDLPNPNGRLREGMYGDLTLLLDESTESMTIPTACLAAKSGQAASVFVVRDGHVHAAPVKTGADDGLRIEILSGLQPEDQVVLNPGQVTDGLAAEPVEASAPNTAKADSH
jgi:HlyD family secretion protein